MKTTKAGLLKTAKEFDRLEINKAFGFVLFILREEKKNKKLLKKFFDKAVKFGILLPQIDNGASSKKIFETIKSSAKKFHKEKPEFIIILSYAFKAVMIDYLEQN